MSEPGNRRIYIAAGEPSGDAHAASVALAIRQAVPTVTLDGTGGARMEAAGVRIRHSIATLGASGLFEAVRSLPHHVRVLGDLTRRFAAGDYDLLVVVDYPGFNLRLAAAAARHGVPVLYYIPPQLWAWGERRAARLATVARNVAVVLPFEEPFLRGVGVPAVFVGHPLLDAPAPPSRYAARGALGLTDGATVLGLFPGSRPHEVNRLWPAFRDAARIARRRLPGLEVVVAAIPGCAYPGADDMRIHRGAAIDIMRAADGAICKSGTTTLEAALAGLPMVVAYRMHPLTYAIARRLVRTRHIGLVNLVAETDVAPELIQGAATPEHLATTVVPLLGDTPAAARQRRHFEEIRARLGTPGAGERVARLALDLAA